MNLETAIKTAIEYETRIRDLYLDASGDIPDPVGKALFRALGEDEQYHLSYLQDRLKQWERSGEITFEALKTTVPSREAVARGVKALRRRMAEDDRGDEKQMLSKALEVNENHAPTLNLMGVVEMHMGDDMEAYDYLKKAMGTDSGHLPTRVNMAALFMRYKDEARARAVIKPAMSRVRTLDLSTPDIHPTVKDALSQLRIR